MRARRDARRRHRGEQSGGSVREWLVRRARGRIESGFYEDPLILSVAAATLLGSARMTGETSRAAAHR